MRDATDRNAVLGRKLNIVLVEGPVLPEGYEIRRVSQLDGVGHLYSTIKRKMTTEGLLLIAFVSLAILIVVLLPSREAFEDTPPVDPLVRTTKLEEDVALLDERTTALEDKLAKQDADINKARSDVDTAATQIQMVT